MRSGDGFVASPRSTRLWRVYKEAGKPFPDLTDDDVLNYLIMEAVTLKAKHQEAEAQKEAEKEAERQRFKKDTSSLEQYR